MRLLMTGSSGFIGSALTPLLEPHFEVFHLKSDLTDYKSVDTEVINVNPDIIVHLAARTEVERSFYEQLSFSEVNYLGTINLIESTRNLKNLKNFVFASTMEVYGWQPISDEIMHTGSFKTQVVFDEHTTPNPNAPYAVAKLACEKYLEYAHRSYGLPFTAIRQTNAYGRRDNDFFVTEAIISRMLQNPQSIKMGYAEPWRNFIFIEDLLNIWMEVITQYQKCNNGIIFTIGPNNPIRIKDYAEKIANKLDWQGQIGWNQQPKRHGEIYWLNSDCNLVNSVLGWQPKITIDEGLDKTIEIWKDKLK
jgi:nucleoside-diphosphate-sugar epimerase|tara:strand:+ start:256 stop:1173 length:918 start_codon:yes stop_codon:yes gene_type:complete